MPQIELQYVVFALLLVLAMVIGYFWGRSNGMQAERNSKRRTRSLDNAKARAWNEKNRNAEQ